MGILKLKESPLTPNKDVVEVLEALLEDARDGEIIGIAIAAQHRKHYFHTSWVLSDLDASALHLIGVLEKIKYELCGNLES
ncbi:MAG: hypothetical protein V3R78_12605 [Thermodesulfobacteriota bacterium]